MLTLNTEITLNTLVAMEIVSCFQGLLYHVTKIPVGFMKSCIGVINVLRCYLCESSTACRDSVVLHRFNPSNGTNLIILAGDIDTGFSPLCKTYYRASDRLLECEEWEKRFYAS